MTKPVKQNKKVGNINSAEMLRLASAARAVRIPYSKILERDAKYKRQAVG